MREIQMICALRWVWLREIRMVCVMRWICVLCDGYGYTLSGLVDVVLSPGVGLSEALGLMRVLSSSRDIPSAPATVM